MTRKDWILIVATLLVDRASCRDDCSCGPESVPARKLC